VKTRITEMLGIEFPIVAFSHCRDVVAAVSKAGGMGVLGAVAHSPESLDIDLDWIEAEVGTKPYGVDVIIPASLSGGPDGGSRSTTSASSSRPPTSTSWTTSWPATTCRRCPPTTARSRSSPSAAWATPRRSRPTRPAPSWRSRWPIGARSWPTRWARRRST